MEYPDKIERVILHLEKEVGSPLSEIMVGDFINIDEILLMKAIYLDVMNSDNINKGVYETSASFYIYVKRLNPTYYSLKIYFKPEQYNEVKFFITRLNKKQNAGINK